MQISCDNLQRCLLLLYAGQRRALPDELLWIILEFSGICGKASRSSFFWIYT
jgi:hypothetical protein